MIPYSRRRLIQQMGAWPLLWPVVRARRAHAQGEGTAPKRVVVIFNNNGPIMETGPATGNGETSFEVHDWWGPLARHKADGNFFVGFHQAGVPFGEHNEWGHQSAGTGALTARTTEKTNNATGPSLDQFIGQELQKAGIVTPKRSLLWGLEGGTGNWGPWYEAAGKPVSPETNPYRALADIAPALGQRGGTPQIDRRLLRKHFVLDAIYKDCKAMVQSLGAEGKALLDFHCGNLESLERSVRTTLAQQPASTLDCSAPEKPNTTLAQNANFTQAENRDQAARAFAHLIPLAFACDITRVIGIGFGNTASRFALPASYNVPSAAQVDSGDSGPQHHAWTHTYNEGEDKRRALRTFTRWYSEQVATIVDLLKSTPDADGKPLLESTLVLWTCELGASPFNRLEPHPNEAIPVVTFGSSRGAFRTGRMLKAPDPRNRDSALTLHQLFVSVIRHAGLTNISSFGNRGSGPLEWLSR